MFSDLNRALIDTIRKKKSSRASMKLDTSKATRSSTEPMQTTVLSPAKLEEILPNMVNRLSPSNIKRTANDLLNEWEKSLTLPQKEQVSALGESKENQA